MIKMSRPILWNILNQKYVEIDEFETFSPDQIIKLIKQTWCSLNYPSFHEGWLRPSIISYAYPKNFTQLKNTFIAIKHLFDLEVAKDHTPNYTNDETCFIICGGGNYRASMYMLIKSLREIGNWKGPIEIWYRGVDDLSIEDFIKDDKIFYKNIYDYLPRNLRVPLHPFLMKYLAANFSSYRKIFYADSDSYFIDDVSCIVKDIETRGGILFPDSRFTERVVWQNFSEFWGNDWFCSPASVCGGHWFLDKEKFQKQLNLLIWMNLHPEFFYSELFPCTDQDILRFCFYMTKTRCSQFDSYPDILGLNSFTALDSRGTPFVYHRWGHKFLISDQSCLNYEFHTKKEVSDKLLTYYSEALNYLALTPLKENCLVSCLMLTQESRKDFLIESISHFNSQKYQNKEMIILYQGSELFGDYIKSICPKAIIEKNNFNNLGEARQRTVTLAKGDVIIQWDDDDLSHEDRLDIQVSYLDKYEACICKNIEFEYKDKLYFASNEIGWNMTLAARRHNFPNYEKISLGEDKGIWDIFKYRGHSICIDETIYRYRNHGNNTSDGNFLNYILDHCIEE